MTAAITPANDDNMTDIDGHDVTAIADLADDVADAITTEDIDATAPAKKKATPKAPAIPVGKLSTREVAEELDIAPSRLRVFLRSQGDRHTPPGSGGRYSFTKTDMKSIKTAFAKWERELAGEKKAK